ncbi:MAG: transposase, partial [Candidatus Nanoarchaeia archaeon]|nr:transposase [Candidatus Nanoarchaeia archaeon]
MDEFYQINTLPFYENIKRYLDRIGYKRYSCKFSKKTFNQHALFFILALKEKLNFSYRRIAKLMKELMIFRNMGIMKVPHFTTLQKFCERLDKRILNLLIKKLAPKITETIIGDGTGFSANSPSFHYLNRLREFTGKYVKIKSPINIVLFADLKTKIITNINASHKKTHEITLSKPLLKKLKCKNFIYDRALDSKEIREKLIQQNITPIIPYRKNNKKKKEIDYELYKKRNNAESIMSSIKRVYGNSIKNKKPDTQTKQAILKALNYNLNIIMKTIKILLNQMISTKP